MTVAVNHVTIMRIISRDLRTRVRQNTVKIMQLQKKHARRAKLLGTLHDLQRLKADIADIEGMISRNEISSGIELMRDIEQLVAKNPNVRKLARYIEASITIVFIRVEQNISEKC